MKSQLPMGDIKPLPRYYYLARVRETFLTPPSDVREFWVSEFSSVKEMQDHFNSPVYKKPFVWKRKTSMIKLLGYRKMDSEKHPRNKKWPKKGLTAYTKI